MREIVMEVDDEFWNIINQLKEFKRQKEIIHCKDCKYWDKSDMRMDDKSECKRLWDEYTYADDFCSRGEPK